MNFTDAKQDLLSSERPNAPSRFLGRWSWGWNLVPALVVAWQAILTWRWLSLDRAFFFWDPGYHALQMAGFVSDPAGYLTDATRGQRYPPLVHVLLGGVFALTRDLDLTIFVTNLSFFAILVYATFGIGRILVSPPAAAIAVALLALYPEVFIRLRFPLLDLPLTAMNAATLYALLRSRAFEDRPFSLGFGLLLGIGQMTKHLHGLIVAGPLLYTLWSMPRTRSRLANLGFAGALAAGVALPWWLPRMGFYLKTYVPAQVAWGQLNVPFAPFSVSGLAYYSIGILYLTSFAFAALWLLSLVAAGRAAAPGFVLSWWLGSYLLLSAINIKNARFGVALLPAVALMTAAGLASRRWGRRLAGLAVAFGVLQAWAISFGIDWLPRGRQAHGHTLGEPIQVFTQRTQMEMGFWPDPEGWGLAEAFSRLEGRVGVLDAGPGAEQDTYRVAHLVEAAQIQHLAARARGESLPEIRRVSCQEANEPGRFDRLLVPVSAAGWPFDWSGAARCLRGYQQIAEWPVRRGPERDLDDFLALRAVRVLIPAPAGPEATLEVPRPDETFAPIGTPELVFSAIVVRYSPQGVLGVDLRVRNATERARVGRAFYAVVQPGMDPWARPHVLTPLSDFVIGPRESVSLALPGSGPLPPGPQALALALHTVDPNGQSRPCHWANARVAIPGVPVGRPRREE
jgi:hypothetical protein